MLVRIDACYLKVIPVDFKRRGGSGTAGDGKSFDFNSNPLDLGAGRERPGMEKASILIKIL